MHRILNIAGKENNEIDFVEHPPADCIFITSVKADLNLLAEFIDKDIGILKNNIRAIHISLLNNQSQIDYYINKTITKAKIVIVRLFGDKGTWSYGLEQLKIWSDKSKDNKLLILSGTKEQEISLNELSNIDFKISQKLSILLRAGGNENYFKFLTCISYILKNNLNIPKNFLEKKIYPDPILYDWKKTNSINIGIISYKSLYLANEIELSKELNKQLRKKGFNPKTVFVSTLKDINIQKKLVKLFKKEKIKLLITTTSFDSFIKKINNENSNDNLTFFEELNIPVLQILSSSRSKKDWSKSTIGINSLDLLMQIIIPEFDGRIITIPCSFKELSTINYNLCCEITKYEYHLEGIIWLCDLVKNYIKLSQLSNAQKKVCLIISNYPIKNSRLGNGVGLNTFNSIINILNWFKEQGYDIGNSNIPEFSNELISLIMNKRTNDPESQINKPLDYLSILDYQKYWQELPVKSQEKIISRWDIPENSIDLEKDGFSIKGISFGKICLLIQPPRGYDLNSLKDIHSPDLPPTHNYLAQYFWLQNKYKTNVICHIGKHGSLEWLPGKSVGLSNECFPQIICPPLPIIYPFIVNDPGEASQAKRRTHATIIDHLTPPLDRSGLYGYLGDLENLIDEYYEARLLNSKRIVLIEKSISELVQDKFPNLFDLNKNDFIESLDSYLCEIKESQIRVGLHTFGSRLQIENEINLILCIARVPTSSREGITQYISNLFELDIDPWTNDYKKSLTKKDSKFFTKLSRKKIITFRKALEFIENQVKYLIYYYFYKENTYIPDIEKLKNEKFFKQLLIKIKNYSYLKTIKEEVYIPLIKSSINEERSFIRALNGEYINSGPSGAPTRGKLEVLPTGKNFFSIDTRGLPSESAWVTGLESANQILSLYKQNQGEDLKNIAISVWATSTMRNGGEEVCQILALMGVKPLWDGPTRKIVDLEIIPMTVLSRPRVDVTLRISGMFRDAFPQLINLISKAVNLIANLNEDKHQNPLAFEYKKNKSINRIFGSKPGSYGAGLQELISNSSWQNNKDLADAYISWSSWKYDENSEAIYDKLEFEKTLKKIQLVIHNQDNKEHDILDSDDYYQFQGGLSASIKNLSGKYPEIYLGDLSKYCNSKISKLSKELDKVIRARVLNPKWTKGMMNNGYKGAFEFAATIDYLYAYDATTDLVSNYNYEQIYKSWLCNNEIKNFLREVNPWALKDIAQRFLEVINRGMWTNKSDDVIDNLKSIINETESKIEKKDF